MNIIAITDIHGVLENKLLDYLDNNNFDILIVAGDITNFGPEKLSEEILNKLLKYNVPIIAIPGNCDPTNILSSIDNTSAINLHNNYTTINNIDFCGFGGSNPTPFDTPMEFSENILLNNLNDLMPNIMNKNITILVTHAPPINTNADKTSDDIHVGSSSIRKIIEKYQPSLNICGHIHEAASIDKLDETIIINPGKLSDGGLAKININVSSNDIDVNLVSFL